MKHLVSTATLMGVVMFCGGASAASDPAPVKPLVRLGTVVITKAVTLDGGTQLRPGTYDVRLTGEESTPATGTLPGSDRQAQFLRRSFFQNGKVIGTAVVNVVASADMGKIKDQEGGAPRVGAQKVESTTHDFLRIWFNKGGTQYLIYLPSI